MTQSVPQTNGLRVSIFGKADCDLCQSAKRKVQFFLNKWDMTDRVELRFHDVDTLDGLTEGAYFDATDVPATLVLAQGNLVARWDASIPPSEGLRQALTEC